MVGRDVVVVVEPDVAVVEPDVAVVESDGAVFPGTIGGVGGAQPVSSNTATAQALSVPFAFISIAPFAWCRGLQLDRRMLSHITLHDTPGTCRPVGVPVVRMGVGRVQSAADQPSRAGGSLRPCRLHPRNSSQHLAGGLVGAPDNPGGSSQNSQY